MKALIKKVQAFLSDDSGATAVEYGLMIALIAAVILVTVGLLGTELNLKFESVKDAVKNAGVPAGGG
jgi:pilus assembly protein Flp/PilA